MRCKYVHFMPLVAAALALAAGPAGAQQLVTNPGFETGNFSGWTLSGDQSLSAVVTGVVNVPITPHGTYEAYFGPYGDFEFLSQVLPTSPDTDYVFSFFLGNFGNPFNGEITPNAFSASFNGTQLASLTNAPAFGYQQFSYFVHATGSTSAVEFAFRNDPGLYFLDDVSVSPRSPTATPEPLSLILLSTGLPGVAWLRRRRRSWSPGC